MKLKKLTKIHKYNQFPSKILKLKRSKWSLIKRGFSKIFNNKFKGPYFYSYNKPSQQLSKKSKTTFYNSQRLLFSYKRVGSSRKQITNYLSRFYKNEISARIILKQYLNVVRKNNQTILKYRKRVIQQKIFKHFFKLSNILRCTYQIAYFEEVKKVLSEQSLYCNDKRIKTDRLFQKGDLIKNIIPVKKLKSNQLKYRKRYVLYPFYQYDAYSQNLVIVKDLTILSNRDFSLMSWQYLNPNLT